MKTFKNFILLVVLLLSSVVYSQVSVNLMDKNDSIVAHDDYTLVDVGFNPQIGNNGALVIDHYKDSTILFSQVFYLLRAPYLNEAGRYVYDTMHRKYGSVYIVVLEGFHMLRFEYSTKHWATYSGKGLKY